MSRRPYVLLSCAISLDGYLDDACEPRLILSNELDLDRVDAVRAECDAILVGANTIRRDNPRLLVRSADRRSARVESGRPSSPTKVTVTRTGECDPTRNFFAEDGAAKIVYCGSSAVEPVRRRLGDRASVRDCGDPPELSRVLHDLAVSGVQRLMVEGGGIIHTQLLTAGLVDELQLVVAPFFVGSADAPRFALDGSYPQNAKNPARLMEVRPMGDAVLLRYVMGAPDERTPR
ncbi:RibD family protein [Micromonospora mirobrigensis]|uniref:5-amino-6-(5-phosphoribosylamino)uracil reductase n=1 Tax=Micromonospora mirobrigensis TaxID=262898 RepID=A0A1C4ZBW7_9ACTN|nr:dihydrofolate reductase family protein [Micromonospora mirobrigensis]SCF30429.1 5-amino-6-(5-phosphoribosylamino)uracil reductase [Micromonospora mirobrigensis]